MTSLISVIVPVYNVQPYLRQCLESLVGQTMHDIEIICVDDGSTDGCAKILAEYAEKDVRVRVITRENGGVSAARNTGLDAAQAPFIMFCDSDDWYAPTMCEKMYKAIRHDADMALCSVREVFEGGWKQKRADKYFRLPAEGRVSACDDILLKCDACIWNKIYSREVIKRAQLRFPARVRLEDEYFNAAYAAYVHHLCFVPERLYNYRRHRAGYTGKVEQGRICNALTCIEIACLIWRYYEEHGLTAQCPDYPVERWLRLCRTAYRRASDKEEFARVERKAIDFARQEILPVRELPIAARMRILLLVKHRWERTENKCGGLIRLVRKDQSEADVCIMQTKCRVLGIPFFSVEQRYGEHREKATDGVTVNHRQKCADHE